MSFKYRQAAGAACLAIATTLTTALSAWAQEARVDRDVAYATIGETTLALDLYQPASQGPHPLVVWVHGGAWRSGSKQSMPLGRLIDRGYAVASVDYRLSTVARFPAQIHDIKAAIRFLRANASRYGIDPDRVAIAGSSAGGHLATLVGVSDAISGLEGDVGEHAEQSSHVSAIINYFGPTNLLTILAQSTPHGLSVRKPALDLLLGGQPDAQPELARLASPVFHIAAGAPPLLILHGDQDPQVPINQAHEIEGRYEEYRLPLVFEVVHGAGHGGEEFFDAEHTRLVADFLDHHLTEFPTVRAESAR